MLASDVYSRLVSACESGVSHVRGLSEEKGPEERFGLHRRRTQRGPYWVFRP